jgi:hypothetical protein
MVSLLHPKSRLREDAEVMPRSSTTVVALL